VTAPGPDVGHGCIATGPISPVEGATGPWHATASHAPDISHTKLEIAKNLSLRVTESEV